MAPVFKEMPADLVTGAAKPTNPKDIVATTKLPLHLIPMITQAYLAIGHFNGLGKYGRDNWRASGCWRVSTYRPHCATSTRGTRARSWTPTTECRTSWEPLPRCRS